MATLLVFTRHPVPGRSKTRLIGALGPEGAAELQALMTRAALDVARRFAERRGARVRVHFTDGSAAGMAERFGADLDYRDQGQGDLGLRLERAFESAFADDAPVIVIGSDCPELEVEQLEALLDALEHSSVAIVPARDGGYVALGLARPCPELFRQIPWSTPQVLTATLERAKANGLEARCLQPLGDVDEPADLERCATLLARLRERFAS